MDKLEIRQALPTDAPAIEGLYPLAFPDEDLLPLVREPLASDAISFVAAVGDALAGHAAFTPCAIAGTSHTAALLGPVAIAPAIQRQGLGSALIRAGLRHQAAAGTVRVFVLGDPAYYGRFGFAADEAAAPPYSLPEEWRGAWQSLDLLAAAAPLKGTLTVPKVWRRVALSLP